MTKRERIESVSGRREEPLPDELPTDCELEHTREARRLREQEEQR